VRVERAAADLRGGRARLAVVRRKHARGRTVHTRKQPVSDATLEHERARLL
jgi:hypothetical protein